MRDNWAKYPPSALPNTESRFTLPEESERMAAFDNSVNRFVKREIGPVIKDYENRLSVDRDPEILNKYGVALAKAGMLDEAWTVFAEAADEGYVWAWNNLASIAFIRREYKLAHSYYEWAESLLADDPVATLGMARSAYEMDLYEDSELLYHNILSQAPSLAERFGYLQSVYGGPGRAWSMADRLTSTVWSEDGINFRPAPAVAEKPVESRPARAPESQPSETPFPASEAEQEREPETPISEPVPEPERIVEEKAETEGLGESEPVLETELSQEPQPEPKLEPSRSPSPPPTIHRRAPEDIEIQQRAAEEV